MKRISVAINEELSALLDEFAKRHQWSRDKAAAELIWRAIRRERRRVGRGVGVNQTVSPRNK